MRVLVSFLIPLVAGGFLFSVQADPPLPVIPTNVYSILDYGAYGDGASNNTAAISNTIAAAATTGGTVLIPSNSLVSTYLAGPFNLTNNINLQIAAGATLKMLPITTFANYVPAGTNYFINAKNLHDIQISGDGTIDGQGTNWWLLVGTTNEIPRPAMLNINGSSRVLIENVTLQNPPGSHLTLKGTCVSVTVQSIIVNTPGDSPNTDAIDLASTNVIIRSCSISCGDDNIAIGSSAGVSADILVTNCTFGNGHGVSIGSYTSSGVSDLIVSNCTFTGTSTGIRLKSQRGRGGLVQNLRYYDITMTGVEWPIIMYSYYQYGVGTLTGVTPYMASTNTGQVVTNTTPIWRDVIVSNVTATGTINTRPVILIWGLPEMLISNVTFCNVNLAGNKSANIYNARAIRFIDSQITVPSTTNTFNLWNADITITNSTLVTNLVTIGGLTVPPTNNAMTFFNANIDINETNVLGAGLISIGGSTLSFSDTSAGCSNPLNIVSNSALLPTRGTNVLSGTLTGGGSLVLALTNANIMFALQGNCAGYTGLFAITNAGTLRFDQGTNTWGAANAGFNAGTAGTINNRATNNITIYLGALTGNSGAKLRGSDQVGAAIDIYVIGGLGSNTTFAGTITNGVAHTVALTKIGGGSLTLSGTNSYTGGTTVSNGTLLVNGAITGSVTVASSGILGGSGLLRGPVMVNGTLAPGAGVGKITISNTLAAAGTLAFELGTNSDRVVVSSNLTLAGTLDVTDAGGFTTNTYTLFTYAGALVYSPLTIGSVPNNSFLYTITTNVAGQVNLSVTAPAPLDPFRDWQMQYFGCTNCPQAGAGVDFDGDGISNTNEFLAGTNPTNNASAFRILSALRQAGDILVNWTAVGGWTNALQASSGDAANSYSNSFADITGPIIVTGSGDTTTNYTDGSGATNNPARYYRVRLVP
jgi:polygalacturonase